MRLDGRQHAPDYSLAVHRPLDLRTNDQIALQSIAELAQQRRRRCGAGSRQLVQLAHRQAEWSEVAREDPDAFLLAWRVQLYLQVEASPDCCVQPVAMVGRSNHEAFVSIETLQEDINDAVHFALAVARIALPLLRQRLKLVKEQHHGPFAAFVLRSRQIKERAQRATSASEIGFNDPVGTDADQRQAEACR